MMTVPDRQQSYWLANLKTIAAYPTLTHDLQIDVAIVGGGITGLSCAYLLKQVGFDVAVFEKNTLASGTTGGTTGKLTAQHDLIYSQLASQLGIHGAQLYADANQAAIATIRAIVKQEKMSGVLETADNFVYTADPARVAAFKAEAKLAAKLGLPASFVTKSELPFAIKGAVTFSDQAKLHAARYVQELALRVQGKGSYVFEHSNITRVSDGEPARLKVGDHTITAKTIILASKVPPFPMVGRFTCAAFMHPLTSYIVAGAVSQPLKGMYISPDREHYSIMPVKQGRQNLVFIGGQAHTPGLGRSKARQEKLAQYAAQHFGVTEIAYRWKAMDYIPYDTMPLIGKIYPWSKNLYIAAGFKKWGLSTSMVAAMILRDELLGQSNAWAPIFTPNRLAPIRYIPREIKRRLSR